MTELDYAYIDIKQGNWFGGVEEDNNNSGHLLCVVIRLKTLMAQTIIITLLLSGNHRNQFAFNQAIWSQWPIIGANL